VVLSLNSGALVRYGGGFEAGASAVFNGSAIVAQSMIRVRTFFFAIAVTDHYAPAKGHTPYICQL
jgi:hypothetical protein